MDIPDGFNWIFLGLTVLHVLGLVPISRRLRGLDAAVRFKARLDLLDAVGSLLLFGGAFLSAVVAQSWLWISAAGFVLMSVGYGIKGVRWLRTRRRSTA
ncbi:hypothetical protein [Streptomyces sp. NPDC002962]|uniref:hypothetical protein n=1 Tax=Streptomyces sp. NPDC002962 TaxID=3364674 RepID=UPI0036796697